MKKELRKLVLLDGPDRLALIKTSDVSWDGCDYEAERRGESLLGFTSEGEGPVYVSFSPDIARFVVSADELERLIAEVRRLVAQDREPVDVPGAEH